MTEDFGPDTFKVKGSDHAVPTVDDFRRADPAKRRQLWARHNAALRYNSTKDELEQIAELLGRPAPRGHAPAPQTKAGGRSVELSHAISPPAKPKSNGEDHEMPPREDAIAQAEASVEQAARSAPAKEKATQVNNPLPGGPTTAAPEPLVVPPASTWAARTPPPRAWTWEGWIPKGRVTSLMGDGGVGKSLLGQTIGTACASARGTLYGATIASGVVLGVFTEEEPDELERRQRPICESLGIELEALDDLHLVSRFGEDNLLATYVGGVAVPTPFYWRLDATCALLRPHLVVLDPAADYFGGNPIYQGEVRQFVQLILGGLCARHDCTVLLPMHPSAAGMASGDGGGFSVAWSNSVRSRLYFEHARTDGETDSGRVFLTRKKSNYAARGEQLTLVYDRGAFVPEAAGGIVDTIRAGNQRRTILAMLAGCEAAGRRVASSPKANENAATILGERPGYPAEFRGKGRSNLFRLLREFQEAGLIAEATVMNANRHPVGVWTLTDAGRTEAGAS